MNRAAKQHKEDATRRGMGFLKAFYNAHSCLISNCKCLGTSKCIAATVN